MTSKNGGTVAIHFTGEPDADVTVTVGDHAGIAATVDSDGDGTATFTATSADDVDADLPVALAYDDSALADGDLDTTLGEIIDIDDLAIDQDIEFTGLSDIVTVPTGVTGEPDTTADVTLGSTTLGTLEFDEDGTASLADVTIDPTDDDTLLTVAYTAAHATGSSAEVELPTVTATVSVTSAAIVSKDAGTVAVTLTGEAGREVSVSAADTTTTLGDDGTGSVTLTLSATQLADATLTVTTNYTDGDETTASTAALSSLLGSAWPVAPYATIVIGQATVDGVAVTIPVTGEPGTAATATVAGTTIDLTFDESGAATISTDLNVLSAGSVQVAYTSGHAGESTSDSKDPSEIGVVAHAPLTLAASGATGGTTLSFTLTVTGTPGAAVTILVDGTASSATLDDSGNATVAVTRTADQTTSDAAITASYDSPLSADVTAETSISGLGLPVAPTDAPSVTSQQIWFDGLELVLPLTLTGTAGSTVQLSYAGADLGSFTLDDGTATTELRPSLQQILSNASVSLRYAVTAGGVTLLGPTTDTTLWDLGASPSARPY
ncbi:MAG: hypothetical protein QM607_01490 [Microbacterium sp.]